MRSIYCGAFHTVNHTHFNPPPFTSEHPVSPKASTNMPPKNIALAKAPFDDPQADLILQSSDKVHFRVFKPILSLASPIFKDMFSIPSTPSQERHDGVQVVHLTTHSTALDVVLRHIYPMRSPKGDKLLNASHIAYFAWEYQVESLGESITAYLTDSVKHDPVGVYAIAVTYGYNDVGTSAARSCLRLPFFGLRSSYLRCATAEHISDLMRYHAACGEAASAVAASDRTWFSSFGVNGIFATQGRHDSGTTCRSCFMPDVTDLTSTYYKNATRPTSTSSSMYYKNATRPTSTSSSTYYKNATHPTSTSNSTYYKNAAHPTSTSSSTYYKNTTHSTSTYKNTTHSTSTYKNATHSTSTYYENVKTEAYGSPANPRSWSGRDATDLTYENGTFKTEAYGSPASWSGQDATGLTSGTFETEAYGSPANPGSWSGRDATDLTSGTYKTEAYDSPANPGYWSGRAAPRCMWNYLHRSALVLAHHPSVEEITGDAFVMKSNGCRSCAQYMRGHLLNLSVVLAGEIRKAIEQVGLSLYPPSHAYNVQWLHGYTRQVPLPEGVRRSAATTTNN